jgi:hypothetical protein
MMSRPQVWHVIRGVLDCAPPWINFNNDPTLINFLRAALPTFVAVVTMPE